MKVLLRYRLLYALIALVATAWTLTAAALPPEAASALDDDLTACEGAPDGYCAARGNTPWTEWISHVTVGDLSRASSKEQYHFYEFDGPATLAAGEQVRVKLTPGLSWSGHRADLYWSVYVDYNRDGDFADDGELVLRQNGVNEAVDARVTVPSDIGEGCTRIRVTMKVGSYAGPCETFDRGEVEDFLATLSGGGDGGGGGGGDVCADRDLTNNVECERDVAYAFYGKLLSGESPFYKTTNGKFVEFEDGTARLTARVINVHDANLAFDAVVDFAGRTKTPPAGSPKDPNCGQAHPGSGNDYYYYPQATGHLNGIRHLAGAKLNLARKGEAFQIGTGANLNEVGRFGGSGWFEYSIASQPDGSRHLLEDVIVDFNFRLSGGSDACFPPTEVAIECPADQRFQVPAGQTQATLDYPLPTARTTCPEGGLKRERVSGPARGASRGPGTYTVTYRATDACDNTAQCSFKITVVAAPVGSAITLACPPDVTTPQIADYGADVFIPVPQASTTCAQGGLSFAYSVDLGSNRTPHFPVGTTTVTVTASDNCGNVETCTFDVTVTPDGDGGGGGDCAGNGPDYPCGGANVGGWEPWWEWISRVQFGSIDNASGKEAYKFFPEAGKAEVEKGAKVDLAVTPGLSYPQYVTELYYTAYIDFNADGDFDDDGEEVLRKRTTSKGVTESVHIPADAASGVTRLRVTVQRGQYAGPCENFSFGEVEDYLVCIGGGGEPAPSEVGIDCPSDRTFQIAAGQTTTEVSYAAPTGSTTCAQGGLDVTRVSGIVSGRQRAAGTYSVRYRATDACGNTAECTFRFVVKAAPVQPSEVTIACPADKTVQIATGETTAAVTYAAPTGSTTCAAGGLKVERVSGPANGHQRAAGTYTVTFKATDACGNEARCSFKVVVKAPVADPCDRDVLFVVGNTHLSHGDRAVLDKLRSFGYRVTVKDQHAVRTADANGKGIVVISSTVHSGVIGTRFTHVAVPVLTWENYLYDDLKMTGKSAGHDYGSGHTTDLAYADAHPIRAGLSGTRNVFTSKLTYRWGRPSHAATVVAYNPGERHRAAIFAYDKGDEMKGKHAPAKRIGWYWDNNTPAHATHEGWRQFRQALAWATGCSSLKLTRVAALQLFAEAGDNEVELNWATVLEEGETDFSLERLDADTEEWREIGAYVTDREVGQAVTLRHTDDAPQVGENAYRVSTASANGRRTSELRFVTFTPAGAIAAYPNPAGAEIHVALTGMLGHSADLRLVNALGQTMETRHIDEVTSETYTLPLSHLPEGGYLLHAESGGLRVSTPVSVVR